MTKGQILLLGTSGVAVGVGVWYFGYHLPKQKKLENEKKAQPYNTTQQATEIYDTEAEVYDANNPYSNVYLDNVGTKYKLNFELSDVIAQPSGFLNLFSENRTAGSLTAHNQVVEKVDFLRELIDKNIYSLYRENPQMVLDYIKQASDYQKYFDSKGEFDLYAQMQPTKPLIVRAKNGKNYLVPLMREPRDKGYNENKILLEKI